MEPAPAKVPLAVGSSFRPLFYYNGRAVVDATPRTQTCDKGGLSPHSCFLLMEEAEQKQHAHRRDTIVISLMAALVESAALGQRRGHNY